MTATGCYFMANTQRKNSSVIQSNLVGKKSEELAMQIIAITISLQPDTGVVMIENNGTKISVKSQR